MGDVYSWAKASGFTVLLELRENGGETEAGGLTLPEQSADDDLPVLYLVSYL